MAQELDQQFIEEVKAKLLAEKERLEKELDKLSVVKKEGNMREAKFPENMGDDPDENAAEVDIYVKNLALEETLAKELKDVLSTLKRIESGKYGVCKFCKQPIGMPRLKVRPTSASCVACKEKLQNNPDKSIKELFGDV